MMVSNLSQSLSQPMNPLLYFLSHVQLQKGVIEEERVSVGAWHPPRITHNTIV